jgi:hypothetical protein
MEQIDIDAVVASGEQLPGEYAEDLVPESAVGGVVIFDGEKVAVQSEE